ncbi:MAG: TlpA family protein disulfide reductase [Burkholderiaceae bacterium]|nr:TlpA family protein disulfide reductase [Burkholderiaceae bacterium]
MLSFGPFPISAVVVLVALVLAWTVTRVLALFLTNVPGRTASSLILDALFVGLLVARLGYIAQWWREYSAQPWSMIAIGDGGFSLWTGVVAALLFVGWRSRRIASIRVPVVAGMAAGIAVWFGLNAVLDGMRQSSLALPNVALTTLDARPIALNAYAGKPVVLNLWASWCPPCRREMPVFEQAQDQFPGVAIVMVNQGESAQVAQAYLAREGLKLDHVLLDPNSETMRAAQSRGLPTTLFFDAEGRLVDSHMGELTSARLQDTIVQRFGIR